VYVLKNHESPPRYYTGVTSDVSTRQAEYVAIIREGGDVAIVAQGEAEVFRDSTSRLALAVVQGVVEGIVTIHGANLDAACSGRIGRKLAADANRRSGASHAPDGKPHRRRRNPPQVTDLRPAADKSPQMRFPAPSTTVRGSSWFAAGNGPPDQEQDHGPAKAGHYVRWQDVRWQG
jgi:hypothetical protein